MVKALLYIALLCAKILVRLPFGVQFALGALLGRLAFYLAPKRRHITLVNITLCYPDLDDKDKKNLVKQVFIHQGIGLFETLGAWIVPSRYQNLVHAIGFDNVAPFSLMMGAHYTTLDLMGLFTSQYMSIATIYRPQNQVVLDKIVRHYRAKIYAYQIAKDDMRTLIARIKKGDTIWYAPDQDYGLEHGVVAPFFRIECATITAQRRFARLGTRHFYFVECRRTHTPAWYSLQKPRYVVQLHTLNNYPSQDEYADAVRINSMIASAINKAPAQYMWFHKRFKSQIDGKNVYSTNQS